MIGAGRIAETHARNVAATAGLSLTVVADIVESRAAALAAHYGASTLVSAEAVIGSREIDAVIVASSTETHAALIEACVAAGKPVYCEKPLAKTIEAARLLLDHVGDRAEKVMIGLNRRFDAGHRDMRRRTREGAVGKLQTVEITSRGPNSVPSAEYLEASGGIFRDKCIHYLDLACWIADETPEEVFAMGAVVGDQVFRDVNDFETGMIVLRMPSGALCQINNSRRAVYGYDDRIEVFGTGGLVESARMPRGNLVETHADGRMFSPLTQNSDERYGRSWLSAMESFERMTRGEPTDGATLADAYRAQLVAEAATISAKTGRAVRLADLTS